MENKMKKIVINSCFGGFGLSAQAEKRYLELIGKKQFLYKQTKYKFQDGKNEFRKANGKADTLSTFTFTQNQGKKFDEIGDWEKAGYFYHTDIPRDDPNLIKVIEEMGEKANGSRAKLTIVEIPDDVDWKIEEYGGNEWVSEKHRTWR